MTIGIFNPSNLNRALVMNTSSTNRDALDITSADASPAVATRVWQIVTLRDRLARRTAVVAWLAIAMGLGLFLGWSWVVAAGLSSLVLGLLPCAAMCAAGLCSGSSGKKCSDNKSPDVPPRPGA